MNQLQTALAEGFKTLNSPEVGGETITFRGASVVALVNLTPPPQPDRPGTVDFTMREVSEIELSMTAVSSVPLSGEFFHVGSKRHKIEKVYPRGDTYLCRCNVTS